MAENEIRIAGGLLQDFTQKVFEQAGLPPQDAAIEAEVLVWANLRGIDSHGVLRIPWYLDSMEKGEMNPRPNIQTIKETAAVVYLEADRAFGPVVTVAAMKKVVEKARQVGIGWALIRNLTHQGAMAYYSLMAAHRVCRHGYCVQSTQYGAFWGQGRRAPQQSHCPGCAGGAPPAAQSRYGHQHRCRR